MADIVNQIAALDEALEKALLPHAFGGALALAWCTERARGTIDIDLNVFVDEDACDTVLDALPEGIKRSARDRARLRNDGQVRLWWEGTPVDLFLNVTDFHRDAATRVRWEKFADRRVPFLSCDDLAVFKAFYNRSKDWADIEEMNAAGTLDAKHVRAVLEQYLGVEDERVRRLDSVSRS